ncbi:hypothetical protein AAEO56_18070 [Flavobacterium sp. DGU11]|uniref:Lipoprotein n=1 Tax=Flavobacterium arundinis TaxID=3139143 RepID=A0ABU9I183_9FLAO
MLKRFALFFTLSLSISCSNESVIDYYKKNLSLEVKGKVIKVDFYKGGSSTLKVRNSDGNLIDVSGGSNFQHYIRPGDDFTKIGNSNKCIVERNDSIIYLDCSNIEKIYRDSLGEIAEWPKSIKGKWKIKN